ncbi:MAG: hypothetical protein SGILL_000822 [Bacillariaceae sp.]
MNRSCPLDSPRAIVGGNNVSGTKRQRLKRNRMIQERISFRHICHVTAIMAMATAAAFCILQVDGFSSTLLHNQHRIRRSNSDLLVFKSPTKTTMLHSDSLVLFGGARRTPSRLFMAKTDPSSDQADWKALLMSLQLYKAAYGDLKVPKVFVVPSMAPWPEAAWGLKLGQKVGLIRDTGLYLDKNEKRRQQLESLGFIWRVRAPKNSAVDAADFSIPFDQIYDALVAYRSEIKPSGPLTVPVEFTVPDGEPWPEQTRGLPLGRSIDPLRSKKYLDENPGAEEKLRQIGFETDRKLSANDKRFQAVYLALKRYKEIYGDMVVPQPFVVPSDSSDWPEESWGLRLGARVNAIRSQGTFVKNSEERREMLDEIGFVWTPPERDLKRKKGRKTLSEIDAEEREEFLEASGPSSSSSTGTAGGNDDVESFLSSFDFSEDTEEDLEASQASRTWGLKSDYSQGSSDASPMDPSDIEPEEEYLPPRTLGESLSEARQRALESGVIEDTDSKRAVKRKREAEIPWFNDDFGGDFVFEDVVEALTLYKKFYGDFSNLTTADFVVPISGEAELSFDDEFDYGNEVVAKANAADVTRFDDIADSSLTDEQLEAEILRMEGDMTEPDLEELSEVATLAPLTTVEWPEHLEGMRLGDIVLRIRDGSLEVKHLPDRKAQLDALDFDWGDPLHFIDVPFEKAMCAMYAYYLVRGDMFVPPEFVMLDEDPWPQSLAGYELGKAVKRIRELQNFFEAFHTDKLGLLRMIDFVWFPTLALPIDPNEKEETPEMLMVRGLGHPDYYFLEQYGQEVPFGFADKIISEGPTHEIKDPRDWWREWHNWEYVSDLWYNLGTRDRAVQLRREGFPQLGDEHEAKYGPGLFQQIDTFLNDFVDEQGTEGLETLLGKNDTRVFLSLEDMIKDLAEQWQPSTPKQRYDMAAAFNENCTGLPLFGRRVVDRFDQLKHLPELRNSVISDPFLSETKERINYWIEELQSSRDIHSFELEYLWLNRLKLFLVIVLGREVFQEVDGMEDLANQTKGDQTDKASKRRKKSPEFVEEELEDIYEDDDEEESGDEDDSNSYSEEEYDEEEFEDDVDI